MFVAIVNITTSPPVTRTEIAVSKRQGPPFVGHCMW